MGESKGPLTRKHCYQGKKRGAGKDEVGAWRRVFSFESGSSDSENDSSHRSRNVREDCDESVSIDFLAHYEAREEEYPLAPSTLFCKAQE